MGLVMAHTWKNCFLRDVHWNVMEGRTELSEVTTLYKVVS